MNDRGLFAALGIPPDYGIDPYLPRYEEAAHLVEVEPNIVGREQELAPATAADWMRMKRAAEQDGIELLIVSGYRSIADQAALLQRKLAAGQEITAILRVNAAPGYSQHHTGMAIDIATPGARPLVEDFEHTPAFGWLCASAERFGFRMPYARRNRFGFVYEPWHWSQLSN